MSKDGFSRFQESMTKNFSGLIRRQIEETGKYKIDRSRLTAQELLVNDVFSHFMEIQSSFARLEEILTLSRSAPPRRSGIAKVSYLKFLLEAHLQESYILSTRLQKFAKWVSRRLRSTNSIASARTARLATFVSEPFDTQSRTRAEHVHQKRFDTEELNSADMLEFVARNADEASPEFWKLRFLAEREYKSVRNKSIREMASNIKGIKNLLNVYFEDVHAIVFGELLKNVEHW